MDSALSAEHLLQPHNEHRIFTGRVVALALFAANGAWDPILETIVNAAIHVAACATACCARVRFWRSPARWCCWR
jgi:hypothetical protein